MTNREIWVVAMDCTGLDSNILDYTYFLSTHFPPEEIHFIYVVKDPESHSYLPEEYVETIHHQLIEDQRLIVQGKVSKHMEQLQGISYEYHVNEGSPFDEVINLVMKKSANMVIAGRKKVSGGSGIISDRLSRKLPCNFLIVPEGNEPSLQNVLVPSDFSDHSTLAMENAINMKTNHEKIGIIAHHSYSVPFGYSKSGKSYEEFASIMKSNSKKEMDRWRRTFSHNITPIITLNNNDSVSDQILEVAGNNKIDLIIIGSKGQTPGSLALLGSNTVKLLHSNERIPMLVVKEKGENLSFLDALMRV